jgi:hypothetical protein
MRKVFAILDIETVTDARLAFDVAWIVCDSMGNQLERYNALISEIAHAPFGMELIKRDRFMSDKSDFYLDAIKHDTIPVKDFNSIADDFNAIGKRYNARVVMCAYNAHFDYTVLNRNAEIYLGNKFFNDDVEIVDILTMALATFCDSRNYVKWCLEKSFITDKGNVRTNAETAYAYLSRDVDFVEQHHALDDCDIESIIYFKTRSYKKKQHKHFANPLFNCEEWQRVQARK